MPRIPRSKAKRPKKAPAKPKGLRVQLKGRVSLPELHAMLLDALQRIGDLGVTHASGINLYLTPVSRDGTPLTPLQNGQSVSLITVEPYRSAADEHGL
jgi:hypothetical protein